MKNYIITISRGLGSGGSHIARILSEELGIPYYDEEILQMASDYSGINESFFFEANEKIKRGTINLNTTKGVYNSNLYKIGDQMYLSNENLFNFQAVIIKNLAIEDKVSCIIVGKAANHIIGSLKNVVKINIQAPLEYCVKNIVERRLIDPKTARELIIKTDKYRTNYYKYYTGKDWLDPREYDMSLNTAFLGEEYSAKLIIDLLKKRGLIE